MKYLVTLSCISSPPTVYRKLVSSVEAALNVLAESTGWDDYEIFECDVLREHGQRERDRVTADTSQLMERLLPVQANEESWYIYGEYIRPGIPWRSECGLFVDNETEANQLFEEYQKQDYLYLGILKIGNLLCSWTKEQLIVSTQIR